MKLIRSLKPKRVKDYSDVEISNMLAQFGGNVAMTARMYNLPYSSLRTRIKRMLDQSC